MSEGNEKQNTAASGSVGPPCSADVVDSDVINQWFDYWELQAMKGRGSRTGLQVECIQRIRSCALSGVRKNRRTKRDVNKLTIERLRQLTDELEREMSP